MQKNVEALGTMCQLKMARDVAQGMNYLSAVGFVHKVSYITVQTLLQMILQ